MSCLAKLDVSLTICLATRTVFHTLQRNVGCSRCLDKVRVYQAEGVATATGRQQWRRVRRSNSRSGGEQPCAPEGTLAIKLSLPHELCNADRLRDVFFVTPGVHGRARSTIHLQSMDCAPSTMSP